MQGVPCEICEKDDVGLFLVHWTFGMVCCVAWDMAEESIGNLGFYRVIDGVWVFLQDGEEY